MFSRFSAPAFFLDQGNFAEAEPLFERSQTIRLEKLGPDHPDVAEVLANRARTLESQVTEGFVEKSAYLLGRKARCGVFPTRVGG